MFLAVLRALSFPLVSAHNSLCGRTNQSGAAAGFRPFLFWFWSITFHLWVSTHQSGEPRETSPPKKSEVRADTSMQPGSKGHKHNKLLWTATSLILHVASVTLLWVNLCHCWCLLSFRCCKMMYSRLWEIFSFNHVCGASPTFTLLHIPPSREEGKVFNYNMLVKRKHSLKWHQVSYPHKCSILKPPKWKKTLFNFLDPTS